MEHEAMNNISRYLKKVGFDELFLIKNSFLLVDGEMIEAGYYYDHKAKNK